MKKLILYFIFVQPILAQVAPDTFFYKFDPNSPPVVNVEINNHYEARTVRVETESTKVLAPGEENEKETKELGLIVSPKSFSLAPNGKRVVRLLLKQPPKDIEEVYRVNFSPKSFKDETLASENSSKTGKKGGVQLTVLMGAGILVFAPPKDVKAELRWDKVKSGFNLTNVGNVNLLIKTPKDCKSDQCAKTETFGRIYPNKSLLIHTNNSALELERENFEGDTETFTVQNNSGTKKFSS